MHGGGEHPECHRSGPARTRRNRAACCLRLVRSGAAPAGGCHWRTCRVRSSRRRHRGSGQSTESATWARPTSLPVLVLEFAEHVRDPVDGTAYVARVYGRARADSTWEGWIEFVAVGAAVVHRTDQETTQSNLEGVAYWASGLGPAYLGGAFVRARKDSPVTVPARGPGQARSVSLEISLSKTPIWDRRLALSLLERHQRCSHSRKRG
jgi:hypothetical protein